MNSINVRAIEYCDDDSEEVSSIRKIRRRVLDQLGPIERLFENLTEKERELLPLYLELNQRDRGTMIKHGQEHGPAFWDLDSKIDTLARKFNCSLPAIKAAIAVQRFGLRVTELDLIASALPPQNSQAEVPVTQTKEGEVDSEEKTYSSAFRRLFGRYFR